MLVDEFRQQLKLMEDQLLARVSLKDELKIAKPSGKDIQYYFEANKQKYKGKDSSEVTFEQVKQKVLADWQSEKTSEKYQEYVQKLLSTDRVKIFTNLN